MEKQEFVSRLFIALARIDEITRDSDPEYAAMVIGKYWDIYQKTLPLLGLSASASGHR